MAAEEELDITVPSFMLMVSAFLAMEFPDIVLSFARELGKGFITEDVQSCIWRLCISKADLKSQGPYLRKFLKKLIGEIESSGGIVLDELYEQFASLISLQDDDTKNGNLRVLKTISFLFPDEYTRIQNCPNSKKLEVQLQCSTNMLEGDTGCSIWPSSLFLSEFILSSPEIFANEYCFELGSGTGLVGICLSYVKAAKVILSDGDPSTLSNMKFNLELNHLSTGSDASDNLPHQNMVHCISLPWESASDDDLRGFAPDIILGADIIYDPSCLTHLVRVLAALLNRKPLTSSIDKVNALRASPSSPSDELLRSPPRPIAYVASVIRNEETFKCFLAVAGEANLKVTDLTEDIQVSNFLPYLGSYQRSAIRLFSIHASL